MTADRAPGHARLPGTAPHRTLPWRSRLMGLGMACTSACTAVVDSGALSAGEGEDDCAATEKLCPHDSDDDDRLVCVDATSPEYGCGAERCSPCAVPGALPRCTQGGACGVSICTEGHGDCDRDESNGCEVSLDLDEDHCGNCDNACEAPGGVADCVLGTCQVVFCSAPRKDCDGVYSNGCETDTSTSVEHCGDCDAPCDGTCMEGSCE